MIENIQVHGISLGLHWYCFGIALKLHRMCTVIAISADAAYLRCGIATHMLAAVVP